ncbi:alpha beta-hydrolase [Nannochloropsis oceanica]
MSAVSSSAVSSLSKNPIVIFPAQFGIAKDYEEMIAELNSRGHPAYAVDLKRFDWLKITKSAVTSDYWKGTLKPTGTLDFYFDAVTATIDQVKAEFPSRKIHLVAHSIGGWVARAYVGEVADPQDVQKRFASLTTLGSPNYPPPSGEGFFSNLDQTRGLLEYVNSNFPGSFHKGMKYVSVGGIGTEGRLGWGLEENVAFISYLPLCGRGGGGGMGSSLRRLLSWKGR